jgi:hypothetical protein
MLRWRQPIDHRTDDQNYSICETLGGFTIWCPCCKSDEDIPDANYEIGLGPSIYLRTVKAVAIVFFIMALINVPLMVIYSQGHIYQEKNQKGAGVTITSNNDEINGFWDVMFSQPSVGNIGRVEKACATPLKGQKA